MAESENCAVKEKITVLLEASRAVTTDWRMDYYHYHDIYEIYLSLTDGIHYFVNDRRLDLKRGDLLILGDRDYHRPVIPEGIAYERCILLFEPGYILDLCTEDTNLLECFQTSDCGVRRIGLQPDDLDGFLELFSELKQELRQEGYGADIRKKISLARILLFVNERLRAGRQSRDGERKHNQGKQAGNPIREIGLYIARNLQEDLSLKTLAERFYISPRQMEYLFRQEYGVSVGEYTAHMRMRKAKELLSAGRSVTDAGAEAGYHNLSHFSRLFRNATGMPPREYAKSVTKK